MDNSIAEKASGGATAERIEFALDSGGILGTWVWDVIADSVTADERFARTFALDPIKCETGMSSSEAAAAIHWEDRRRVEELIGAAMRTGGRYRAQYRVLQRDGAYRWIEASGRCELDGAGRPVRFAGVLVDIDERKRAEDRLRHSENEALRSSRLLQAVIEAVPALIYVKDRAGRLNIANGPVLELVGKTWSEVVGRTDAEFLDDPEQGRQIMATDQRLMETGESQELEEVVGADAFGPRVWLSHKRAFRDEQGAVIGLVGTSVDITARKRAEEQRQLLLLELNHRVKNLFALACSMATMSARSARSPDEMADALTGRLMALAQAHELIHPAVRNESEGESTGLSEIVSVIMEPHLARGEDQLSVSGPPIALVPPAATALALILHELATNAAKYGALSRPEGRVAVSWNVDVDADAFELTWVETDGPPIADAPDRIGFGSKLARQSAAGSLGGEIVFNWERTGLRAVLKAKRRLVVGGP